MPRRSGLTAQEEILLHLYISGHYTIDVESPYSATREGISRGIGMKLNHLSRELRALAKLRYVTKKKAHVLGFRKRIDAYLLTKEGVNESEHLMKAIMDMMVKIMDELGNVETITLETVYKRTGGKFSAIELLRMRDIDTGRIMIPVKSTVPKEQAEFYGRRDELDALSDWFINRDSKILVLYGIAGIGKTSIVSKFTSSLDNWPKFYLRIHEWDSIRGVLDVIADALMSTGDERLQSYLKNRAQIDNTSLSFIFHDALSSHRLLLILDDVWTASKEIWEFISLLCNAIIASEAKMILISREFPAKLEGGFEARGLVTKIRLEGLKNDEARQLLESRGLGDRSDELMAEAIRLLRGHPLLLKMVQDVEDIRAWYKGDVARFIHRELYSRLNQQEITALNSLAVLRHPIQVEYLRKTVKYEIIESLHRKAVIEYIGDSVTLHDMIRSFVLSYLSENERREYHRLVYGIMPNTNPYLIEKIYHAISAGLTKDALHELISNREHLISLGYAKDIITLLDVTQKDELPSFPSNVIILVRMNCLSHIGDYPSVIKIYEKEKRHDMLDIETRVIAAETYLETGNFTKADEIYQSLEKKRMDVILKVRIVRGLGGCAAAIAKYRDARSYYLKALTMAKKIGREDIIGRSLLDLGTIEVYQDQAKIGTKYFLEAMRYLRMNDYPLAAVYGNLSLSYYQQSMYEMALGMVEHSEILYNRMGDYVGMLKTMINKGTILHALEKYNDSETVLLRTLRMSRDSNMKPLITSALTNLSYLYLAIGKYEDARTFSEDALRIAEKLGQKYGVACAKNNLASSLIQLGKIGKAISLLKENLKLCEKIGAEGVKAEAAVLLSEGYRKIGDHRKAEFFKNMAYTLAKEKGMITAVKRIEKMLKKAEAVR